MLKVVLVDDEPLMLKDLQEIIEWDKAGFEVVAALSSGQELISLIKYYNPDLIITDIVMPQMSGIDICEYMGRKSNVPVILVSAYNDFEYARKAIHVNAFEYLTKPVEKSELMDTLMRASEHIKEKKQQFRNLVKGKMNELINEAYNAEKIITDLIKIVQEQCGAKIFRVAIINADKAINIREAEEEFNKTDSFITPIGNMKYLCLFMLQNQKQQKPLENSMKKFACEHECRIGVSTECTSIKNIMSIIEQAEMMSDGFFCNQNHKVYIYQKHDINSIFSKLKKLDSYSQLSEFIKEIPAMADRGELNPEEVCVLYYELLNKLAPQNATSEKLSYKQLAESYKNMDDMIDYLLQFFEEDKKESGVSTKKIVRYMVEYISDNYSKKIYLSEFAEKYFLHPKYLGTVFKNEVGKSFVEYLVEVRLKKAEELLKNNELYINEISEMVGYDDYFHFSKLFKKYKGVSPSKYRAVLLKDKTTDA